MFSLIKNEKTKSILTDSALMMLNSLFSNFLRLALISFLSRYLLKEELGLWVTITSLTAILIGGDFGVVGAIRNKFSQLLVEENGNAEAQRYFLSALYFFLIVAVVLSVGLFIFRSELHVFFKSDNEYLRLQGQYIILAVQVIILFNIPLSIGTVSFFSFQETKLNVLFGSIQSLLSFVAVVGCVFMNMSIVLVSIVYFLSTLIVNVASTVFFLRRRKWRVINIHPREIYIKVKELMGTGIKFFLFQFANSFLLNAGTVITSSQLGMAEAAEFNLVQKLYMFALIVYQSAVNPLWGKYASSMAVGNWKWVKKVYLASIFATGGMFFLFTIFMLFFGNFILNLFVGSQYEAPLPVYFLMGVSLSLYAIWSCAITLQNAMGRLNLSLVVSIFLAVTIVPFSTMMTNNIAMNGLLISLIICYGILMAATVTEGVFVIRKNINSGDMTELTR